MVGGGDTATEEAAYLTKYGKHVHLLVRGPRLRASKAMQDRVYSNPRVTVHVNTAIEDAFGDSKGVMVGLRLVDTVTGEKRDLPVRGLFYGIGHQPNSGILGGQIELDAAGYILVKHGGAETSVEGVFSAGDIHDTEWRQAITAAGSGCMAALSAERYLTSNGFIDESAPIDMDTSSTSSSTSAHTSSEGEANEAAAAVPVSASVSSTTVESGSSSSSGGGARSTTTASSSGGNSSSSTGSGGGGGGQISMEEEFNVYADRHRGQFALRRLYHESDRLMVVLYTSPSCGPCRTLKPILSKVVDEYAGKIHYVEIDIEQDPEIAQAGGVNGTPTVQFFKNKERVVNWPGVKMKKEYKEIIDANL